MYILANCERMKQVFYLEFVCHTEVYTVLEIKEMHDMYVSLNTFLVIMTCFDCQFEPQK